MTNKQDKKIICISIQQLFLDEFFVHLQVSIWRNWLKGWLLKMLSNLTTILTHLLQGKIIFPPPEAELVYYGI